MSNFFKHLGKFKFIYLTITAVAVIIAGILVYASSVPTGIILKGIKIGAIDVGGMTKEQAEEALQKNIVDKAKQTIKIKADTKEVSLDLNEIEYTIDVDKLVNQAYNAGHIQSFGQKIAYAFGGAQHPVTINIDNTFKKKPIKKALVELKDMMKEEVNDFSHKANYKKGILTLKKGEPYQDFKRLRVLPEIYEEFSKANLSDYTIQTELTEAAPPDVDVLYSKLVTKTGGNPTVVYKDGEPTFTDSEKGIEIKKADFVKAYNKLYNSDEKSTKVSFVAKTPDVSLTWLQNNLFKDTLGACDNAFYSYNQTQINRGINIRKACSKLNNLIINPGEVFSYNKVVGPRAKETGFAIAGAYRDGQNTMEYGGGVCQTSSSLYRCALFADMEIIYRKNHTFTVGYVPLGEDATVSHPTVDFKFRNTSEWPIKIVATTVGNHLYVKIMGTMNPKQRKKVTLNSTITSSNPAQTVTKYSSSLPKGKRVWQNTSSHNGYVVQTYKTLYINGVKEYTKKITTSYYRRMDKVVVVGTGKKKK